MKKESGLKRKLQFGKKTVLILTKSPLLYGGKTTQGTCTCPVETDDCPERTTPRDKMAVPDKVVFLINDRCLSAAELFLNYASQSKKSILMGKETYGGMNYLEVNSDLHFPCDFIRLNYPVYRSDRVDYMRGARGVKPHVYLTQPESEWLNIAIKYLKKK